MTVKKIFSDAAIYFTGQLFNRGIAFFLLPLYTRYLSPEDYGILSIASTLTLIFGLLASLSLDAAVGVLYFKLDESTFRSLLLNIWLALLLAPLILISILEAIGTTGVINVFPNVPWSPYLSLAVWIAYLGVFPNLWLNLLRSKQRAKSFTAISAAIFVLQTAAISYFVVFLRGGALGSLRGQLIAALIVAIAANLVLFRWSRPWDFSVVGQKNLLAALFLGLGYFPHIFSIWVLNVSDRWILGYSVSAADIGIYSLAYTIGMLVHFGGIPLISAFYPTYFKNSEDAAFRSTLKRFLIGNVILHTISALAVSLLALDILRIMTREAFYGAAFYVPFIALGYWFYVSIYQICLSVIENRQRTHLTLYLSFPAAILNVILNLIFVPHYGILAASINTLLAFALMAVLSVFVSRKLDRLPFSWFKITQTSGLALFAFWFGDKFLSFDSLFLSVAVKSLLVGVVAGVMILIAGFSKADLESLFRRERKVQA